MGERERERERERLCDVMSYRSGEYYEEDGLVTRVLLCKMIIFCGSYFIIIFLLRVINIMCFFLVGFKKIILFK
jgi:hypothetical protein